MLDEKEVAQHNSRDSCWVIIAGNVYNVTEFLDDHPGGSNVILRYGGKDATEEYDGIHPEGTIENTLSKINHLGPVQMTNVPAKQASSKPLAIKSADVVPLSFFQNLSDFEDAAKRTLTRKAWVYFSSAAESLSSHKGNMHDWSKVSFRPRVLRDVARVKMQCSIMGHQSPVPFFIAPAAVARLGNKEGELCLARGAARQDISYCVSTYSSVGHGDLATCLREEGGGALLFQLYVPIVKEDAIQLIAKARQLGFRALVVTVDCAVVGKREADDLLKAELDFQAGIHEMPAKRSPPPGVEPPVLRGAHSSTLGWDDLSWIRKAWENSGPFILKGIQTAEDAFMACDIGVDGIYLSNHGGRQLDFAPSSLQTLLEIRRFCPEVLEKVEVYVDGGVTRGTDVIKALCLGATGVGLGRPFMYALSAYGTEGVVKAIQILSDEIETALRLMGVADVNQLNDNYVNASELETKLPRTIKFFESKATSKL